MADVERIEIPSGAIIYPAGLTPHDLDDLDSRHFAVRVEWKGRYRGRQGGGYAVTSLGDQLSRNGRDWSWDVPKFRRWQHRWETMDEALAAARAVVDERKVNGRTWAEWQEVRRG